MAEITPTKRIGYLDATRGIAAFMVLIYHFTGWNYPELPIVKWSHVIFNGADAVSFFFVLSGFVLSYPYLHHKRPLDLGKFYIKRIYRLFPGFLVALAITAIASRNTDLLANPLKTIWDVFAVHGNKFWKEAMLFQGQSEYLGVDWTLTIELAMSFLIPFLVIFTVRDRRLIIWFACLTLLMTFIIGVFVTPFSLGVLAAAYFDEIQSDNFKKTFWYRFRIPILILSFLLFSLRELDRIFHFGNGILYLMELYKLNFFMWSGITSFVFIVYIIHFKKVQRFLEHRFLLFIGKISYGIYLLHWFLVALTFQHWTQIVSLFPNTITAFIVSFIVCAGLTIALATGLYYWVEQPFILKSKRFVKRMKPTLLIESDKENK